jgi:hypothetical protein
VNLHVAKVAGAAPLLQRAHEITRALESDDFAHRADDFSQIDGGVTRPGAEVEDAAADRDSGSLPAIQGDRTPNPMLQSEPGNFLIVSPEDVIAFRGHAQTIPPARIFPRRIFVRC